MYVGTQGTAHFMVLLRFVRKRRKDINVWTVR